jgi:hypothetical protein
MPVTTAAFDEPFEELPERALLDPDRCELLPLDEREPDEREPLDDREDELRPREEAADERLLDALVLFGLLRELADLLPELDALLPLEDVLRVLLRDAVLFGLDPFELREVVFLLLCDREPVWAISPP